MNKKKHSKSVAVAAAVLTLAAVTAVAPAANASDRQAGSRSCGSHYSWSGANSTASTTHLHEQAGWWKRQTFSRGYASMKGWKGGGAVWIELTTSGRFSSYGLGCSS